MDVDKVQQRFSSFASALTYEDLPPEVIHTVKVRMVDTLGCLIGGFSGEPSRIARTLALEHKGALSATLIGTPNQSSVEMAAFANAATVRYLDYNDVYGGGTGCHPSDNIAPILGMAEAMHASGRDLITAIVIAYEIYMRINDSMKMDPDETPIPGVARGFDYLSYSSMATGVGAGKVLGLTEEQLGQCMALAIVPNITLGQTRDGELSMWKGVGAGQAGKAGVFAALLARAGMEGPNLPFEGEGGFLKVVSAQPLPLDNLGASGVPFRILSTNIKPYAACGGNLSSIAAALEVRPQLKGTADIKQIIVYLPDSPAIRHTTREITPEKWRPETRETADHSVPYTAAAALIDGFVGPAQFTDARMRDPGLLALLQKVEVRPEPKFTGGRRCRVEVVTNSGQRLVGEVNGIKGDTAHPMSDAEIETKFLDQAELALGKKRARAILDTLWHLEEAPDVAPIPKAFVL